MPDTRPPFPDDPDDLDQRLDRARIRGQWDVEAMWHRLRAGTVDSVADEPADQRASLTPAPVYRSRAPMSSGRPRASRMAAILRPLTGAAIAAAAAWLIVSHRGAPTRSDPVAAVREYVTGRGEMARIDLSDGSHVTLAPRSRLRIPSSFGTSTREVTLEGEAIFDVHHDTTIAFRVRAGGAELTDVGTRFSVRALDGDHDITVAVEEGAVSFGDTTGSPSGVRPVLVRGGSRAIRRGAHIALTPHTRLAPYFTWERGTLSFDDAPLGEVLETLGRWYDLDIVADPSVFQRRVTAELMTQQPSAMLDALAAAVDAHLVRAGARITLTTGGPPQ